MSQAETPTSPDAPSSSSRKGRSPVVIVVAVVIVLVVVAGGAYAIYKATQSKDDPKPFLQTAKDAVADIKAGNDSALRDVSTGGGTAQLLAIKPNDVDGFTIVARSCQPAAAKTPTRVCVATRPGGQLVLRMIYVDDAWKIDQATVGPTAVTPPADTPTSS